MYLETSKKKFELLKNRFDAEGIDYRVVDTSYLNAPNAYKRFEFSSQTAELAKKICRINEEVSEQIGEPLKTQKWLQKILDRDLPKKQEQETVKRESQAKAIERD